MHTYDEQTDVVNFQRKLQVARLSDTPRSTSGCFVSRLRRCWPQV